MIKLSIGRVFVFGVVLFGVAVMANSCAQQVAPSGGKKDKTPPRLINANPPNKTTNFDGNTVELEFHEFVELGNARKEVFVSPPLDKDPNIIARRKTVKVEIPGYLKDNTTYSIYFNNAVKDLTEGNSPDDLKYVFSTGRDLDSQVVKGKVVNGKDLKPEKGVSVGLYRDFGDSSVVKKKPFYLAETNDNGEYRLENVKKGPYQIFALGDENGNLKLDPGEKVGFYSDTLFVKGDTTSPPDLKMFKQHMEGVKIVNSNLERPGKLAVEFNRKVDTVNFFIPGIKRKKADAFTRIHKDRMKADFWFTPIYRDSLSIVAKVNKNRFDTLTFNRTDEFFETSKDTTFEVHFSKDTFFSNKPFFLDFPDPIKMVVQDSISLKENDSTDQTLSEMDFELTNKSFTKGKVTHPFKADSTYYFRIGKKAFKDMFGRWNKPVQKPINVEKRSSTGLLEFEVKKSFWESPVLVQLINSEGRVIREITTDKDKKKVFDFLFPGEYRLRAIKDWNQNGRWDGGDWFQKQKPEPVHYYENVLTIKANWEVREIDFQIPSN